MLLFDQVREGTSFTQMSLVASVPLVQPLVSVVSTITPSPLQPFAPTGVNSTGATTYSLYKARYTLPQGQVTPSQGSKYNINNGALEISAAMADSSVITVNSLLWPNASCVSILVERSLGDSSDIFDLIRLLSVNGM